MKRKIYHVGNEENKAPRNKGLKVRIEQKAAFSYWFKCWANAYFIKDMQLEQAKARFSRDIDNLKQSLEDFSSDYLDPDPEFSARMKLMNALLLILQAPKPTADNVDSLQFWLGTFFSSKVPDSYINRACSLIVSITILIHGKKEQFQPGLSLERIRLQLVAFSKEMMPNTVHEEVNRLNRLERRFLMVLRDMTPLIADPLESTLSYQFGGLGRFSVSIP